jgi:hypothetical protein
MTCAETPYVFRKTWRDRTDPAFFDDDGLEPRLRNDDDHRPDQPGLSADGVLQLPMAKKRVWRPTVAPRSTGLPVGLAHLTKREGCSAVSECAPHCKHERNR